MPDAGLRATAIGALAVPMWSMLALLAASAGALPPFQLTATAFLIGGLAGLAWIGARGALAELRQPWPVWLHGVGGLFGYHALYFAALRSAPPVQAGLIAYLWPLMIVLLSALRPGGGLRWHHLAGALAGLGGTVVIVTAGTGPGGFDSAFLPGYAAALACAVVWSAYSVTLGFFPAVPAGAVAGFCLATAALASLVHLAVEETVWPASAAEWTAVLLLGLFPLGAAFYVWDFGLRRGDVRLLGVAAYAAPVLSTLILILGGRAEPRWSVAIAAILVAAGAAVASSDLLRRGPGSGA